MTNTNDDSLGTVTDSMETRSNDIFIVKDNDRKKEHWIPYTDDAIVSIDTENKQIVVDWDPDF